MVSDTSHSVNCWLRLNNHNYRLLERRITQLCKSRSVGVKRASHRARSKQERFISHPTKTQCYNQVCASCLSRLSKISSAPRTSLKICLICSHKKQERRIFCVLCLPLLCRVSSKAELSSCAVKMTQTSLRKKKKNVITALICSSTSH